jgi:hypothetical protein
MESQTNRLGDRVNAEAAPRGRVTARAFTPPMSRLLDGLSFYTVAPRRGAGEGSLIDSRITARSHFAVIKAPYRRS